MPYNNHNNNYNHPRQRYQDRQVYSDNSGNQWQPMQQAPFFPQVQQQFNPMNPMSLVPQTNLGFATQNQGFAPYQYPMYQRAYTYNGNYRTYGNRTLIPTEELERLKQA